MEEDFIPLFGLDDLLHRLLLGGGGPRGGLDLVSPLTVFLLLVL